MPTRFLVAYETSRPLPDHPPLIAVLRSLRATRLLPTVWVLESELEAFDICRHVIAAGCLDPAERILVAPVAPGAAWRRLAVGDAEVAARFGEGEGDGDGDGEETEAGGA